MYCMSLPEKNSVVQFSILLCLIDSFLFQSGKLLLPLGLVISFLLSWQAAFRVVKLIAILGRRTVKVGSYDDFFRTLWYYLLYQRVRVAYGSEFHFFCQCFTAKEGFPKYRFTQGRPPEAICIEESDPLILDAYSTHYKLQ